MKEVKLYDVAPDVLDRMAHGGVFFTVQDKSGRCNTMNIGWGSLSCYWNGPVFIAPIRHNRYTYELLQNADSFTVSVPLDDGMKEALTLVGTRHGNEEDKYALAHLTPLDALSVNGKVIGQCALHIECRIALTLPMDPEAMDPAVRERWYGDGDFHTLYFGPGRRLLPHGHRRLIRHTKKDPLGGSFLCARWRMGRRSVLLFLLGQVGVVVDLGDVVQVVGAGRGSSAGAPGPRPRDRWCSAGRGWTRRS